MFIVENTGTVAWKKILDEDGNYIASLDELYNGDWSITKKGSFDWVAEDHFSSPSKAVTWLWKNRFDVGEPFSLYQEKEKTNIKKKLEPVVQVDEPSEDLFWDYKK